MHFVPRTEYCWTCGASRGIATLRCSIGFNEVIKVGDHRELQRPRGVTYEQCPQLIVNVGVWRNGGSSEDQYICDPCLHLGLGHALKKLALITSDPRTDQLVKLTTAAVAAKHALNSVMAVRDGITDELLQLVINALGEAIEFAEAAR